MHRRGTAGLRQFTTFRWLSLKAHLHKETVDLERSRIIGFYVSCSSELQNRLSWLKT